MSTMKVWLTAKAVSQNTKLYGATVQASEQGGKYVALYLDPINPTVDMPRFAREHVRMITYTDAYHEGFRPEGMYEFAGAKAMVKTVVKVQTPHIGNNSDNSSIERRQEISISAKSIKALREIHTRIRQGTLSPTEKWSDGGKSGVTFAEVDHTDY